MPGPVTDPRAGALLRRYRETFGGEEIPVPVESIAEDLLGLRISESEDLECSGLLVPAERRIWVNAAEARQAPGRRRFTIAHELGHWVCQVLEGRWQPVFCRAADVGAGHVPPGPDVGAGHVPPGPDVGAGLAPPSIEEASTSGVGAGPVRPVKHPPLEREANVFAAELLMPESLVRGTFTADDSPGGLAERFGVSGEAMHWRLYNAGLIEEAPS